MSDSKLLKYRYRAPVILVVQTAIILTGHLLGLDTGKSSTIVVVAICASVITLNWGLLYYGRNRQPKVPSKNF